VVINKKAMNEETCYDRNHKNHRGHAGKAGAAQRKYPQFYENKEDA